MCLKPIREVASEEEKIKIVIRLRIDWNPMAQIKPRIEHENLGARVGPIYLRLSWASHIGLTLTKGP
jgi:hypothetical protein